MHTPPSLPSKQRKDEQWKIVPGSLGKYWISNYGRVIAQRLGFHELKPLIRYKLNGEVSLVQVEMRYRGKRHMITLSHMVYALYVQKLAYAKKKPVIAHKDGNRLNLRWNNLVLSSYTNVFKAGFEDGSRRTKFQDLAKPVSQYSRDGKFIATYSSAVEAAKKNQILRQCIYRAAREMHSKCFGCYWRYGKSRKKLSLPVK